MAGAGETVKLLAAAAAAAVLLLLSGLAFTGTVASLVLATPALVLFSPVIVPAGIAIVLAGAGLLISGGLVAAAASAAAWVYCGYTAGGRRSSVADLLRAAHVKNDREMVTGPAPSAKVARTAGDVVQWGRELGPKAREITGEAAAMLSP